MHYSSTTGKAVDQFKAVDWAKTSLGPMENWPATLKTTLGILFSTQQPMVLYWGNDYVKFYNDAFIPTMPGKHPFAMGKPAKEVWQEIWEDISPNLKIVMEQGKSTWYENQLLPIMKNGKLEDAYWTYSQSPVFDVNNKVAGVLVICSDNTSEFLAKRQLEESKKVLNDFFMQAPLPMCILSGPEHEYLLANQFYEEFIGSKVVGKNIRDVLSPDIVTPYLEMLDGVYQTAKPYVAKNHFYPQKQSDGSIKYRNINFIYQPTIGHSGKVEGIMVVFQDITEEMNKSLHTQRIFTDTKLAALGMMAAEIAHEIKNPLAIIRTSCTVLKMLMERNPFEKELALTQVEGMNKTVERVNDIVNSMRNLASDTSREEEKPHKVSELVEDILSLSEYQMKLKNINFTIQLNESLASELIVCRRFQLSQVLLNLISNAQHAIKLVQQPKIDLIIFKEENLLILRVLDNGPGVPPDIRARIFSTLFTTKDITEGTGLGLNISREIVTKSGGTLTLNDQISSSCFEIRLPMKK